MVQTSQFYVVKYCNTLVTELIRLAKCSLWIADLCPLKHPNVAPSCTMHIAGFHGSRGVYPPFFIFIPPHFSLLYRGVYTSANVYSIVFWKWMCGKWSVDHPTLYCVIKQCRPIQISVYDHSERGVCGCKTCRIYRRITHQKVYENNILYKGGRQWM